MRARALARVHVAVLGAVPGLQLHFEIPLST